MAIASSSVMDQASKLAALFGLDPHNVSSIKIVIDAKSVVKGEISVYVTEAQLNKAIEIVEESNRIGCLKLGEVSLERDHG